MANPTYGFQTYKGEGARLLPPVEEDGKKHYANVMARDGYSGWKKGIMFVRTYAYQEGSDDPIRNEAIRSRSRHLYRVEAIRMQGLDSLAVGFGRTNREAHNAMYDALKTKGVMPQDAQA